MPVPTAPTARPPHRAVPAPRQGPRRTQEAPDKSPPRRRRLRLPHYTWSGTAAALVLAYLSFTPSLLPRGWILQGVIAGITASIGYGLGVTVWWFVREFTDRRPSPLVRRRAWQILAGTAVVLGLVTLWLGLRWQQEIHELVGLEPPAGYQSAGIVPVALIVFVIFVGCARGLRRLTRWLMRGMARDPAATGWSVRSPSWRSPCSRSSCSTGCSSSG